jgi:TIR domain
MRRPSPGATSDAAEKRPDGGRVFMCHASEDKLAVRDLYKRLTASGYRPWLDEEDLLPGQNWDREITRAVRAAQVVLVCLSKRSEKRGYVQKEIRRALDVAEEQPEGTIFLIPVRLEDCAVPDRLAAWHWVDLHSERGYSKLEAALESAMRQMLPQREAAAQVSAQAEQLFERARPVAEAYERLRREPAGPERTARMTELVDSVRASARESSWDGAQVKMLFDSGRDGMRVYALGLMQGEPALGDLCTAINAIKTPRSNFEQYQALLVAQMAARESMDPQSAAALALAIEPLLSADRVGQDRLEVAQEIKDTLNTRRAK